MLRAGLKCHVKIQVAEVWKPCLNVWIAPSGARPFLSIEFLPLSSLSVSLSWAQKEGIGKRKRLRRFALRSEAWASSLEGKEEKKGGIECSRGQAERKRDALGMIYMGQYQNSGSL